MQQMCMGKFRQLLPLDDMLSGGGCELAAITCSKCAWASSANCFPRHQPSSAASGQRSDDSACMRSVIRHDA